MIMDYKKWLLDNYTFFEDMIEFEGSCFLEFCLKEEAVSFVKLCCDVEVPFSYYPPYGIAIEISHLENLIKKCEMDKEQNINQKVLFESHPLLKLH